MFHENVSIAAPAHSRLAVSQWVTPFLSLNGCWLNSMFLIWLSKELCQRFVLEVISVWDWSQFWTSRCVLIFIRLEGKYCARFLLWFRFCSLELEICAGDFGTETEEVLNFCRSSAGCQQINITDNSQNSSFSFFSFFFIPPACRSTLIQNIQSQTWNISDLLFYFSDLIKRTVSLVFVCVLWNRAAKFSCSYDKSFHFG